MDVRPVSDSIRARASAVRLLACDVDGVLTDGKLQFYQGSDGVLEGKSFSILDGFGVKLLQQTGVVVALITGRSSDIVARRALEMGVLHVAQGVSDKKAAWRDLLAELALAPEQSAYIGDDWPDLAVIRGCGLGITVPNAPELLRRHAHYVTSAAGGAGAVREACELIMTAQGTLARSIEEWLQ
ncbi:MAG: HAD hydrolase family protein [Betaproteobacteria bacterium]